MAHLPRQHVSLFAQGRFGRALVGDVGMDSDPFDDLARVVEDRQGADGADAPHAVMAAQPMFMHIHALGRDGFVPAADAVGLIVGMDRIGPAEILILVIRLAGQCGPAGLFADHPPIGAVAP